MKAIESKRKERAHAAALLHKLAPYARAQISVLFALAAVTLVGVMALGADVGVLYYNWGQLQKAADAAALAGASYLPNDTTTATSVAQSYATKNGIQASDVVTATPINSNKQMVVTVQRTVPYNFARVLGLTDGYVKVSSTASVPPGTSTVNAGPGAPVSCGGSACTSGGTTVTAGSGSSGSGTPFAGGCGTSTGAYNVLPIVVDSQTAAQWSQGASYTLNRMDASSGNGPWVDAPGNWGFVQLCGSNSGNGGSGLRSAIADGYYGELSIGNTLSTLPGVKNGPVGQGLQGLQDRAPGSSLTPTPTSFNPSDPRAVIIPMASFAGCSGQCNLTITGFLAFYINQVDANSTNTNGVKGAMIGTFIAMVDPNSTASINAPNAGAMGDVVLIH
jgi:Flp pilus assembly protein TadG